MFFLSFLKLCVCRRRNEDLPTEQSFKKNSTGLYKLSDGHLYTTPLLAKFVSTTPRLTYIIRTPKAIISYRRDSLHDFRAALEAAYGANSRKYRGYVRHETT